MKPAFESDFPQNDEWGGVLALIPVCLLASYSAQRLKNNWPAFIGHALTNFIMIPLLNRAAKLALTGNQTFDELRSFISPGYAPARTVRCKVLVH